MTAAGPSAAYRPAIGLEVHCQLQTASKMFSACPVKLLAPPNTYTDPYTWGLPGTLPVPNRRAVELGVRLAVALGCEVRPVSRFARKHYFYPDLPKGYQITQSDQPFARGGRIMLPSTETASAPRTIRLIRVHIEEDAGKNIHPAGAAHSLIDYNRAGAALLEIVSAPDLDSPAEAADYLRELRRIVRYLGISEANMEEGTLRCDANVSVRRSEQPSLGTRCEIKNLNSFKFLEEALQAEIQRQVDLIESGGKVVQSTLSYDPARRQTRVMRTKEQAADYRYFPDPDLPPLCLEEGLVAEIRAGLPELPAARRGRYRGLGLSAYDAAVLAEEHDIADYFDAALRAGAPAKPAANWITGPLSGALRAAGRSFAESPVRPADVAELVSLVESQTISLRTAREDVFRSVFEGEGRPLEIVERRGYRRIADRALLARIVREVLERSPAQVEQYRQGKHKLMGYFVGQVMRETQGQADPQVVQELLTTSLAGGEPS